MRAGVPHYGVAEDATKYASDGGVSLYRQIRALGMVEDRISVRWNPADPTTIQDRAFLDRTLPVAAREGVRVVFDVYATEAPAFALDTDTRIALFAAYVQTLARTYPQVRDFIIGNEPNEAYFWQPQFGPAGEQLSAPLFLRMLAASYDALESVNPAIRVIAGGPSGSGNDRTSTSPVRFMKALGDAYRASGRGAPIMDALGFHLYPLRNTDSPETHYAWPMVGGADLARLKQAVWDAFAGTAQPIFAEGPALPGAGLELVVDEFGWQAAIDPSFAGSYTGAENVPAVTEDVQAKYYADLIRALSCDPAVSDAMVFHLIDERDLDRFQSGLLRVDGSERPSFGAVRDAIAGASCAAPVQWAHASGVVGAVARFNERARPARTAIFGLSVTAAEEAYARAGIFRVRGPRVRIPAADVARWLATAGGGAVPARAAESLVKAGFMPRLEFHGRLAPGYYVFAVRLVASMNPGRTQTFVSSAFRVGS